MPGIGEEVADFEVGQLRRDRLEPQERDTPVLHTMLLTWSHTPRAVHGQRPGG
jgi:hypothetical protein